MIPQDDCVNKQHTLVMGKKEIIHFTLLTLPMNYQDSNTTNTVKNYTFWDIRYRSGKESFLLF
jgi:hypothetical protein